MGKLIDFLSGTKVLEVIESPINGEIEVIRTLGLGIYLQVDGLTQSGGILYAVWKKPLKKILNSKFQISTCLILGLGGGTVAKIVRDFWPEAEITGVELDPVMLNLGKKYLELDEKDIKIVEEDAFDFVKKAAKTGKKYDIILNDVYVGHEVPKRLESENYIQLTRSVLASSGIAVFNRLYYGEKRPQAAKFGNMLERIFSKVEAVYPEANVMFICYS